MKASEALNYFFKICLQNWLWLLSSKWPYMVNKSRDNNFLEAIIIIKARKGVGVSQNCSRRCGETCRIQNIPARRMESPCKGNCLVGVGAYRLWRGIKENQGCCLIFFIRTEPVFFPYNRFIQGFMRLWPRQSCNSILTYSFSYFP